MRVRIRAEYREVVRFSVQYETDLDGTTYPVVRYDMAHGFAHRDLLDRAGRNVAKLCFGDDAAYSAREIALGAKIAENGQDVYFRHIRVEDLPE